MTTHHDRLQDRGLAEDGLVDTSARASRPWMSWLGLGVAIALALGGLVETVFPAPPVVLLGAEKARAERLQAKAQIADGSAAKLFEHERKQVSQLRRSLGAAYGKAQYLGFHEVGERLLVGAGGRLYLPTRIQPQPIAEARLLGLRAAELQTVARRLAAHGIDLVLGVIPRKVAFDAEHLPAAIDARPELDAALIEALRGRGLVVADLWHALSTRDAVGVEIDSPYYQLDSHWNQEGARRAAEAFCDASGLGVPRAERGSTLRLADQPARRADLPAFAGFSFGGARLPHDEGPRWDLVDSDGASVVIGDARFVRQRTAGRGAPIALVGTSFSKATPFPLYLSHCLDRPVWNASQAGRLASHALVDFLASDPPIRPRVLFLEIPAHELLVLSSSWAGPVLDALDHRQAAGAARSRSTSPNPSRGPSPVTQLLPEFVFHDTAGALYAARERDSSIPVGRYGQRLVELTEGMATHTGGGTFAIRLRGHVSAPNPAGAFVNLLVNTDTFRYSVPWHVEQEEIVLPLLGWTPGHEAAIGVENPPGKRASVRLDSVAGVVDAVASPEALPNEERSVVSNPDGDADAADSGPAWEIAVQPPARPLEQRTALLLRAERPTGGAFRVEVGTVDGRSQAWTMAALEPGGVAIVELDGFVGRRLARILITPAENDHSVTDSATDSPRFVSRLLLGPQDPARQARHLGQRISGSPAARTPGRELTLQR